VDSDAELVNEQLSRFHGSTLYSGMLPFVRSMLKLILLLLVLLVRGF
jgi:hypothetical protein